METKTTIGIALALTLGLSPAMSACAGESTAGTKTGVPGCKTLPRSGFSLLIHSTAGPVTGMRCCDVVT